MNDVGLHLFLFCVFFLDEHHL